MPNDCVVFTGQSMSVSGSHLIDLNFPQKNIYNFPLLHTFLNTAYFQSITCADSVGLLPEDALFVLHN